MKREGVVYGMSENEYHAPKDELSSSGAKLILESPAKYKYEVIDGNRNHRAAFDLGTAVHTSVLGVGSKFELYPDEHITKSGAVSTSRATVEWQETQWAAGKVLLSPSQASQVEAMTDSVMAHPTARMLFERHGQSEVSLFDEVAGVKRRCRFDYLPDEGGIVVDLKTTLDASPVGFGRSVKQFKYHIQRSFYLDMLKRVAGREAEMVFVAVEKSPPYSVGVYKLNEQYAEIGDDYMWDAIDTYRTCMTAGVWPGYSDAVVDLQPSMGEIYDHQDKFESGEIKL